MASVRVVSGPVSIVRAPGRTRAELVGQGQAIVMVAEGPGIVEITVSTSSPSAAPEASFSLDLLDRGTEPVSVISQSDSPPGSPGGELKQIDDVSFEIEAHVSRIGDIRVPNGTWVAGPETPLPIEGLTLIERQESLGLEMQVQSAAHPGSWSPWSSPGHFAGTRQRAEYLTGIRLKLTEARVSTRIIVAEALFLGASVTRKEGAFVEFSSRDPLVGLKIDVVQKASVAPAGGQPSGPKIRVFRAQ